MSADGVSLLSFLDAPLLVGDPEGRVVYVNPAFAKAFQLDADAAHGEPLGELFAGGGREAILGAVARVCGEGRSLRFRLREGGAGYLAVASPIEADDDRVGVIILLTDEPVSDERLFAFHREMQEPLEEILACFEDLIDQTGGRRSDRFRGVVERGLGAVERVRKWSGELHALISGRNAPAAAASTAQLDPVRVLRQVAARLSPELGGAGVRLEVLAPPQLPAAVGDADALEAALVDLLRQRIGEARAGSCVTLAARVAGEGDDRRVLVSVVDAPESERPAVGNDDAELTSFREGLLLLGVEPHCVDHPIAGRATSLALPLSAT